MKFVVVSPHLDDAAFSLSLAIAEWLDRGDIVELIHCFPRSEFAPFSDIETVHPNDRRTYVSGLRAREEESWRKQLTAGRGRNLHTHSLNLKDAPLRLRCTLEETQSLPTNPEDKSWHKIQRAIAEACSDSQTALLLPLALDKHLDHRTAREALLPFIQENPQRPCAFYEDLPAATQLTGPEIEATANNLALELTPLFAGKESETAVPAKRRLALAYDSQIDDATASQIADFATRYGGRERIWANPAWLKIAK